MTPRRHFKIWPVTRSVQVVLQKLLFRQTSVEDNDLSRKPGFQRGRNKKVDPPTSKPVLPHETRTRRGRWRVLTLQQGHEEIVFLMHLRSSNSDQKGWPGAAPASVRLIRSQAAAICNSVARTGRLESSEARVLTSSSFL